MTRDALGLHGYTTHKHQSPSLTQVPVRGLRDKQLPSTIEPEDAIELGFCDVVDMREAFDAGVGDDNVQVRELGHGLREQRDDFRDFGAVGADGDGFAAEGLDGVDGVLGGGVVGGVVYYNVGAIGGQFDGYGCADTFAYV